MLKGQKINEDELGDIVNNTDRSYLVGKQDYILLLKKQKDKNYSTLYVTDCEANFWIRKVDSEFFEELRASLNVNSDLGTFSRHFITSLGQKSRLQFMGDLLQVIIELEIGEGLVMNCVVHIENKVSLAEGEHGFRMILKLFFKQLYEAKQSQREQERSKWQALKNEYDLKQRSDKQGMDPAYIKKVLGNDLKKESNHLIHKSRNLMNPNKKKRKCVGVKLGGGNEECE